MLDLLSSLLVVSLLAGCVTLPPQPFRSPLTKPVTSYHVYMPMTGKPLNKLGMAGCPDGAGMAVFGGSWCYSWRPNPTVVPGVETVPMLWDATQIDAEFGGNSRYLMLFNEPNEASQANLTPFAAVGPGAVGLSRGHAAGLKVVCPAPSQRDPGWVVRWRDELRAVGIEEFCDVLAVHCYGDAAYCQGLVTQFAAWAVDWGISEVWVTETGQPNATEAQVFTRWLETQPLVTRYAPFVSQLDCAHAHARGYWDCATAGNPSLLTAALSLTERGTWYAQPWDAAGY